MNAATINITGGGSFGTGYYRLILGSFFTGNNFVLGSVPQGFVGTLIFNGSSLDINIAPTPQSLIFTWTGNSGVDAKWMTSGNWSSNSGVNLTAAPAGNASEQLIFDDTGTNQATVNNFPNGTSFSTITFTGTAASTAYGVVSSNPGTTGDIVLNGSGTVLSNVNPFGSTTNFAVGLTLVGAATIQNGASNSLTLGILGTSALNMPGTLTLNNSGTLTINDAIAGLGGLTQVTGTGTTVLAGANTYSGAVAVNAGNLQLNTATALGTNTSAGGITVTAGATLIVNDNTGNAGLSGGTQQVTLFGSGTTDGTSTAPSGALRGINGAAAAWAGNVAIGTGGSRHQRRRGRHSSPSAASSAARRRMP